MPLVKNYRTSYETQRIIMLTKMRNETCLQSRKFCSRLINVFCKIHFYVIFPYTSRSLIKVSDEYFVWISHFLHACCVPRISFFLSKERNYDTSHQSSCSSYYCLFLLSRISSSALCSQISSLCLLPTILLLLYSSPVSCCSVCAFCQS